MQFLFLLTLQFCPAGDLIFEVYLERREPEQCCLIKLTPGMRSSELVETALSMRNATFEADELWTTFEVIENGELVVVFIRDGQEAEYSFVAWCRTEVYEIWPPGQTWPARKSNLDHGYL
ncbi:hypothetical protein AMECASPLE_021213 [Ameca splendens]|uniref:Uncharacterized protein n=1 Tax=Ameca splendens TaxID=208324 RepID=A0ABV0XGJ1_9TELE